MPHPRHYLALDLGAESGRGVLGRFDGERIATEEVHRFPNEPVRLPTGLHWDALRLFADVNQAIAKGIARTDGPLDSIGVDTWGVDFGLLDRDGALLGNPVHYRDGRTAGTAERIERSVGREAVYAATGIQFMPINTLNQLVAMAGSPQLGAADRLLLMADLLNYWLCGEAVAERTIASTTQLYDPGAGTWATPIADGLGIPSRLFPAVVDPGTPLGPLLPFVADEVGGSAPVVAVGGHDTASAVAAVPAEGDRFAYISSGTWSLVGIETAAPIRTPQALAANCTNEVGVGGTIRFLKNVMGLWLLQECRRTWAREGETWTYDDLIRVADAAPPFGPLFDPDRPEFVAPGDMPSRVRAACAATGQTPPAGAGPLIRCVFESLALKYRRVLETIEAIAGWRAEVVHVVGGGSRNALLCALTADATGRPVLAGPVEATAVGNLLTQAMARGDLASLAEIRAVVRRSTNPRPFAPDRNRAAWDDAYQRFGRIMRSHPEGEGRT